MTNMNNSKTNEVAIERVLTACLEEISAETKKSVDPRKPKNEDYFSFKSILGMNSYSIKF